MNELDEIDQSDDALGQSAAQPAQSTGSRRGRCVRKELVRGIRGSFTEILSPLNDSLTSRIHQRTQRPERRRAWIHRVTQMYNFHAYAEVQSQLMSGAGALKRQYVHMWT